MKVREPRRNIVEGLFYPAEEEELKEKLPQPPSGKMNFLLLPHADWTYIETCQQKAWPAFDPSIESLLIVGPVHREAENKVYLSPNRRFHTPLGDISLDRFGANNLEKATSIYERDPRSHEEEHVLEIHFPMLRAYFPGVYLLPLLVGTPDPAEIDQAGAALKQWAQRQKKPGIILSANLLGFIDPAKAEEEYRQWSELLQKGFRNEELIAHKDSFSGCALHCICLLNAAGLLPKNLQELDKYVFQEEGKQISYSSWGGTYEG